MKKLILLGFLFPCLIFSQKDSFFSKFNFEGDFRFRVEQDWNSRKPDGTYRTDRSRLRYRLRSGFTYHHNEWASIGARIRTGDPRKQQDPQLTLGQGWGEFGTLPIALEKVYFQANFNTFKFWLGKNTYPFEKQNELFWSDNVYPEGVFFQKNIPLDSQILSLFEINLGHFIVNTNGESFKNDKYFQGFQINSKFKNLVTIFPGFYIFKNMPNIPDGGETYNLDYKILNIGARINLHKKSNTQLELNYLNNFQDYQKNDSIPSLLKDQKSGWIFGLNYGKIENKKDWQFKATYTYLERYAAVDFFTQNDWARWDYSAFDSPDGRLTNFKGIELVGRYCISPKMNLTLKYYKVEQLIHYGPYLENGDRIRLDLDIKF